VKVFLKWWLMAMVSSFFNYYNYLASPDDIYLSTSQIRLFGLKPEIQLKVWCVLQKKGEIFSFSSCFKINGHDTSGERSSFFWTFNACISIEKFKLAERQSTNNTYYWFVYLLTCNRLFISVIDDDVQKGYWYATRKRTWKVIPLHLIETQEHVKIANIVLEKQND
jgi:hypothetical protein